MITYEIKAFNLEEIRDTSEHLSDACDNRGYILKTVIIENDLNEDINIEILGSAHSDFSKYFIIDSWTISANTNTYKIIDKYIPFVKIKASCEIAPISGNLSVILEEVS